MTPRTLNQSYQMRVREITLKLAEQDIISLNRLAKRLVFKYGILNHDHDDYLQEMVFRVWDRIENDGVEPDDLLPFANREMTNQLLKIERGDSFTADPDRRSRRMLVLVDDSFLGYVGTKLVPAESVTSPLTEENDPEERFTSVLEKGSGLYDVDEAEHAFGFHWARDMIRDSLTRRQYQFFMIKYGEGNLEKGLPIAEVAARMNLKINSAEDMDRRIRQKIKVTIESRFGDGLESEPKRRGGDGS